MPQKFFPVKKSLVAPVKKLTGTTKATEETKVAARKKVEEVFPDVSDTEEEALVEYLGGEPAVDVEERFGLSRNKLDALLRRRFPNADQRFQFLEDICMQNALLAADRFQQTYEELSGLDAAKASGIFVDRAVNLRKARENGFKEPPLNIGVILNLEKTLQNALANANAA